MLGFITRSNASSARAMSLSSDTPAKELKSSSLKRRLSRVSASAIHGALTSARPSLARLCKGVGWFSM
jgi:hypothetical protein